MAYLVLELEFVPTLKLAKGFSFGDKKIIKVSVPVPINVVVIVPIMILVMCFSLRLLHRFLSCR